MAVVQILAGGILAAAFAVSAAAKLLDHGSAREGASAFGVPERLAPSAGVMLPVVEAALAVALLLAEPLAAGGAALLLLSAFSIAVAAHLVRGSRPMCNCFGSAGAKPISGRSLLRNASLGGLAAVVVTAHGSTVSAAAEQWSSQADPKTAIGPLLAVVVLQAGTLIAALRRRAAVHPSIHESHGLPIGSRAPEFELMDIDGVSVSLSELLATERPTLAIFIDPDCAPCQALLPEVEDWQRTLDEVVTITLITKGSAEATKSKIDGLTLRNVLLQQDDEVAAAYRYEGTPGAVLISPDRRLLSPIASGVAAIRQLVADGVARADASGAAGPAAPALGAEAPVFRLQDGEGGVLDLQAVRGGVAVVMFWGPDCGFCTSIAPDVRAWEAEQLVLRERGSLHTTLVVVSSGHPSRARQGFRSQIGYSDSPLLLRAYGVTGTPSAILVDARGRVSSDLAIGTSQVLMLLSEADRVARTAATALGVAGVGRPGTL